MATIEQEFRALNQMQPRVPNAVLEKVHEWKGMGENLLKSVVDYFSEIECREQGLVSARVSLEKRERDLEERERKFDLFEEEKKGELMLREENLDEQLRLVREHIERLEAEQGKNEGFGNRRFCEKLREIEDREREVDAVCGSIEKRLRDVEMKEKEFDKLCNGKLRELKLKEGDLNKEKKRFAEEVKLVDEELKKKQKATCDLIERMESALKMVEKMKVVLDEKFKVSHESLTAKLNEADWVKESLDKRFEELEKIEEEFNLFREEKTRELESKEQELGTMRMELLKDVNVKQEHLSEEQKCLEHMVSKKVKEIESLDDSPKDADLSRESLNTLNNHGKMLEMFVNRTEKDLELMGDEILNALFQSSDPAKFVLDAVDGLYTSRLGKGSEDSKLRGVCILLLDQLTKVPPIIEPCVRGAAIKLATEWMSKLNTAAENPLEVLVLLNLLAAYNLASCFDKNELFSFAKSVVQHKQAPSLCRILGLAEKIPGIIQNLINEKQFLLASTYIYEFGLEDIFPQKAVLDFFVRHSMISVREICRWEQNSLEAQGKAIASEIADLHVAIEHIIKYGLESVFSPDYLTQRIKQLERNQANLKVSSPSSGYFQKQGKGKRNRMDEHLSFPQKAQDWRSRRDGPSPVGFRKHEVPMTRLSRPQKRRRKRNHDSVTIKPTLPHQ